MTPGGCALGPPTCVNVGLKAGAASPRNSSRTHSVRISLPQEILAYVIPCGLHLARANVGTGVRTTYERSVTRYHIHFPARISKLDSCEWARRNLDAWAAGQWATGRAGSWEGSRNVQARKSKAIPVPAGWRLSGATPLGICPFGQAPRRSRIDAALMRAASSPIEFSHPQLAWRPSSLSHAHP